MKTRNRRSYSEIFLDRLRQLSNGEPRFCGNTALRSALRWDQNRYNRIKAELVRDKKVVVGRGKGGTVRLGEAAQSPGLTVFIAYSHVDEGLKNDLLKHLEPLKRLSLLDAWHDRKLKAGEEWDKSISTSLEKADIILLLVSIDFINSKYCYEVELYRALERHSEGSAVVVPVILRTCLWQYSPFAKLQAVPKDGKAVCTWNDRDEAFTSVAEAIKMVADGITASR
jgi:hypothetical protein